MGKNGGELCCPLTGVTMAAGDTRLVFMHQPGFPSVYRWEWFRIL